MFNLLPKIFIFLLQFGNKLVQSSNFFITFISFERHRWIYIFDNLKIKRNVNNKLDSFWKKFKLTCSLRFFSFLTRISKIRIRQRIQIVLGLLEKWGHEVFAFSFNSSLVSRSESTPKTCSTKVEQKSSLSSLAISFSSSVRCELRQSLLAVWKKGRTISKSKNPIVNSQLTWIYLGIWHSGRTGSSIVKIAGLECF